MEWWISVKQASKKNNTSTSSGFRDVCVIVTGLSTISFTKHYILSEI